VHDIWRGLWAASEPLHDFHVPNIVIGTCVAQRGRQLARTHSLRSYASQRRVLCALAAVCARFGATFCRVGSECGSAAVCVSVRSVCDNVTLLPRQRRRLLACSALHMLALRKLGSIRHRRHRTCTLQRLIARGCGCRLVLFWLECAIRFRLASPGSRRQQQQEKQPARLLL
jgi:hypothetical protein